MKKYIGIYLCVLVIVLPRYHYRVIAHGLIIGGNAHCICYFLLFQSLHGFWLCSGAATTDYRDKYC